MPKCLVLDLDGTISDSLPDIAGALNRSLARHGKAALPLEQVRPMVGDGVGVLFQRGYAARGLVPSDQDMAEGLADYTAHSTDETYLYPGALEALRTLKAAGWHLAVCTNKPGEAARILLDHLGVLPLLDAVGAGDSFAVRKPDPDHIRLTLHAAGATLEEAVMIGDHHNDVAAGKGAGLPTIFAAWGYGPAEVGKTADAVATRFADVPGLCAELRP
ncbi:MAG TPA: HAD-IA family hydrolase [Acidisoma sp.]|jgi:phosphoglycolate phosphatase|uniref:HAD family hydrolase n=1 Tax=Acidisoma sp. TaxID=1872115 RepID=UPI002D02EA8C|nr:HAD-IA family hydrolase [Acidisoma sp.]HTI02585.1 HAD-IA family hydrolase [Acidisoma sp.]